LTQEKRIFRSKRQSEKEVKVDARKHYERRIFCAGPQWSAIPQFPTIRKRWKMVEEFLF